MSEREATTATLDAWPEVDCPHGGGDACPDCVAMCDRPCWTTPADAERLIAAGYGDRLMLDWWVGERYDDPDGDIAVLAAASTGYAGKRAPEGPSGFLGLLVPASTWLPACSQRTPAGHCALKRLGLQPSEGHRADCQREDGHEGLHRAVAMTWNTPEAQALARAWLERHGGVWDEEEG